MGAKEGRVAREWRTGVRSVQRRWLAAWRLRRDEGER